MKLSLGQWLEVVGMAGVIISLIMVGYQLKQNTDMQRVDLLMQESHAIIENERLMMESEHVSRVWAKSLTDPANLTLAEQRVMEGYLWTYMELLRTNYRMKEAGLLSNEDWRFRINTDVNFYLGNEYAWGWFLGFSHNNFGMPSEIIDTIKSGMQKPRRDKYNGTINYMKENQKFIQGVIQEKESNPENKE